MKNKKEKKNTLFCQFIEPIFFPGPSQASGLQTDPLKILKKRFT
jgi:hypothetical protein